MRVEMTHEEIQELLGAYALDAVDGDERDLVDAHLSTCPQCRAEVTDHRESAALLAFSGQDAPEGLWDRIAASIEEPPPPLLLELASARAARDAKQLRARPWRSRGLVAAAAVVVGLLAFGVAVRDDGSGVPSDNPRIQLASADGRHTAEIVLADGRGYIVDENLPELGGDRVYQLWGKRGDELISLGLLGTDPGSEEFVAGASSSSDGASMEYEAFAITVERAGGVASSDQDPIVVGKATSTS